MNMDFMNSMSSGDDEDDDDVGVGSAGLVTETKVACSVDFLSMFDDADDDDDDNKEGEAATSHKVLTLEKARDVCNGYLTPSKPVGKVKKTISKHGIDYKFRNTMQLERARHNKHRKPHLIARKNMPAKSLSGSTIVWMLVRLAGKKLLSNQLPSGYAAKAGGPVRNSIKLLMRAHRGVCKKGPRGRITFDDMCGISYEPQHSAKTMAVNFDTLPTWIKTLLPGSLIGKAKTTAPEAVIVRLAFDETGETLTLHLGENAPDVQTSSWQVMVTRATLFVIWKTLVLHYVIVCPRLVVPSPTAEQIWACIWEHP